MGRTTVRKMFRGLAGVLVVRYLVVPFLGPVLTPDPGHYVLTGAGLALLVMLAWKRPREEANALFLARWERIRSRGTGLALARETGLSVLRLLLVTGFLVLATEGGMPLQDTPPDIRRQILMERLVWLLFLGCIGGLALWNGQERRFQKLTGGHGNDDGKPGGSSGGRNGLWRGKYRLYIVTGLLIAALLSSAGLLWYALPDEEHPFLMGEAILRLELSRWQVVALRGMEGQYLRFPVESVELLIHNQSRDGWTFREQLGNSLFFDRDGEVKVVTTRMVTRRHQLMTFSDH